MFDLTPSCSTIQKSRLLKINSRDFFNISLYTALSLYLQVYTQPFVLKRNTIHSS
jgi:hypothetical protein